MLQDPSFQLLHQMRKQELPLKLLEVLHRQQLTAGLPEGSSWSTPPGEADYFEGVRLMETV